MGFMEYLAYLYFVLAIGYNLVSIVFKDVTKKSFAPTDPTVGALIISVLLLIYSSSAILEPAVRTSLLVVFLLLITRFGIARHVIEYSTEAYFSRASWLAAIAINIFGVAVLSLSIFL